MRPFATREEAIHYFKNNNPYSQCDFVLIIESTRTSLLDAYFALNNFTFPNVGVSYSLGDFGFPHPSPKTDFSSMHVTYYQKKIDNVILFNQQKNFNQLWSDQFSDDGLLEFIPAKDRPKTYVYTFNNKPQKLLELTGCVLTYPKPQVNYGSQDASLFELDIFYEDCTLCTLEPGDTADLFKDYKKLVTTGFSALTR